MLEENDHLIIRCPLLGGEISFQYCRTVNENLPCQRIVVCWEYRLEISKFLREHYSADQIQHALFPPTRSKVETIVGLIEKAKKVKEEGG